MSLLLWTLAVLLVALGLLGLILPALPGPLLLFVGLLCAAWAEDFAYVGTWTLILLAVLSVLIYLIDFAAAGYGARRFGASKRATVGAALGAFAGLFFGLPGIFLGPFVGAVIGELSVRRNFPAAGRAGVGASVGFALGVAGKLALAFAMVGIFLLVRWV